MYFDFTLSLNVDYQNAMILKTSPFFISPLLNWVKHSQNRRIQWVVYGLKTHCHELESERTHRRGEQSEQSEQSRVE